MNEWTATLKRYYPKTPNALNARSEEVAWERDIRAAIPDVKLQQILAGIRASVSYTDPNECIPTPALVISWTRRQSWEQRQIDKRLAYDADKDAEKIEVHNHISDWLAATFKGESVDSEAYQTVMDGDKLQETDEIMVDGTWKVLGKEALDESGRQRRLIKYANTQVRRRV